MRTLAGLPENFQTAVYARNDHSVLDHLMFPLFLRGLSPDLVHIPLNRVPLLMVRPYVVTIHDLANLFFEEEEHSGIRMQMRRYRFRRGLARANRVIAVSEATKRDVENLMGVPPERISPRLQCARPRLSPSSSATTTRRRTSASWSDIRSTIRSCSTPATSAATRTCTAWSKHSPWCASNWPRIPLTRDLAWSSSATPFRSTPPCGRP